MRFFINVKDYNGKQLYSAPLDSKDKENKDICYFLDVSFVKCTPPTKNVYIEVVNGFFSSFQSKNGTKPKLVVMQYNVIEKKQNATAQTAQQVSASNPAPKDENPELPF